MSRFTWQNEPDLLNVQNFTPAGFQKNKIYAKKSVKFVKILIPTKLPIRLNIIYSTVFNIRLYKTAT